MMDLVVMLVFLLGLITVLKFVLNLSSNVITWTVVGIVIYMALLYFKII